MFRARRLRRIRALFLDSCRTLNAGRAHFDGMSPLFRGLIQAIVPMPLLGLDEDGGRLLAAMEWLEDQAARKPLHEAEIKGYHRMILPPRTASGEYRRGSMTVAGSSIPRPPASRVPFLMKSLDSFLRIGQERLDVQTDRSPEVILQFAVEAHQRVALIHPFEDGNGRVARLALNHLMRRYGQGYVILPSVDRSREHFETLEAAHRGELDRFVEFSRRHIHPVN